VRERWRFELLAAHHDRRTFSCGVVELDRYFRQQVTQDIRRRITSCFVALTGDDAIAGYYTLASGGIPVTELPPDIARRLPRYPTLPAVRIGRLAVDTRFRGQGFGRLLLWDATQRALRAEQANFTLLVDAKDEAAVEFYRHYGFVSFATAPRVLSCRWRPPPRSSIETEGDEARDRFAFFRHPSGSKRRSMSDASSAAAALPPASKMPAANAFLRCCSSSMRSSTVPCATSL